MLPNGGAAGANYKDLMGVYFFTGKMRYNRPDYRHQNYSLNKAVIIVSPTGKWIIFFSDGGTFRDGSEHITPPLLFMLT